MKTLSFTNKNFKKIDLRDGENLSEVLNIHNSPILFGCRTGLCGACLVEVVEGEENLHSRTEDEEEYLGLIYPGKKKYRLGCQISIDSNIKIRSKKELESL